MRYLVSLASRWGAVCLLIHTWLGTTAKFWEAATHLLLEYKLNFILFKQTHSPAFRYSKIIFFILLFPGKWKCGFRIRSEMALIYYCANAIKVMTFNNTTDTICAWIVCLCWPGSMFPRNYLNESVGCNVSNELNWWGPVNWKSFSHYFDDQVLSRLTTNKRVKATVTALVLLVQT